MEAKDQHQDCVSAEHLSNLDDIRAFFATDRFATDCAGATILEAQPGHAVCSFEIADHHRNGFGAVMGGAIFTLADFAGAVASNVGQPPSVTLSSSINYISSTKGTRLYATCDADRSGKRTGFYTARVTDDQGKLIAVVTSCCLRA